MFNHIPEVLRLWIDTLARTLMGWEESWRARNSVDIWREAGDFLVRVTKSDEAVAPGRFPPNTMLPPEVIRTARYGLVVLELPPDEIVLRLMSVPAQARDFLPGVIRNQIERLSPWRADQVAYGFDAQPSQEDAATLDVRVLLTPLRTIASACADLSAIGLTTDRVVSRERNVEGGSIVLWSRQFDSLSDGLTRWRRLIGVGLAGCAGFSLVLTAWAVISATYIRETRDDVASQATQLQRRLEEGRSNASNLSLNPAQRAWYAKTTSPSAIILLEALSRALPDSAYLTDLSIQNLDLRISGLTDDAPSLIAPLESSGHFKNVHFFAPTTQGPHDSQSSFHIEAKVNPSMAIAEN